MVILAPELRPESGADHQQSHLLDEISFLSIWDDDIKRAARAAARGHQADSSDLAQQVRTRLVLVYRKWPEAAAPYLRVVIANTIRSALRRESRAFSTRSLLAQEIDDELELFADEPSDGRPDVIVRWVARLPERLRTVYQHLYAEERSQRETALLLNVSQPRVAQLHRQLLELGRQELIRSAA